MFKVGDKVIPHSKSKGTDIFPCIIWKDAMESGQKYLFITGYEEDLSAYTLSNIESDGGGSYYSASDITLYNPILEQGQEL